MPCPACGHPLMVEKIIDERLEYQGQSLTRPPVIQFKEK